MVAIALVFISFTNVFIDFGLGSAIIQKVDLNDDVLNTIFFINIILGILFSSVLFFFSSVIALWFGLPELEQVIQIYSFVLLLTALSVVQNNLIRKKLQFKRLFYINFFSTLLSSALGIVLCIVYKSYWALIIQNIVYTLLNTIQLWINAQWKPNPVKFKLATISDLLDFSTKNFFSGLLNFTFDQLDRILVGKTSDLALLGHYIRAKNLLLLPRGILSQSIGRALYPVFSSLQHQKDEFQKLFSNAQKSISIIVIAIYGILYCISEPLIVVLYGSKWSESTIYLQLMTITGFCYSISTLNVSIITSMGKMSLQLKYITINRIMMILALIIGVFEGIIPMLYAFILIDVASIFLSSYFNQDIVGISFIRQIKRLAPILFSSAIAILATYYIGLQIPLSWYFVKILLLSVVYLSLFIGINLSIQKDSIIDLLSLFRN